MLDDMLELVIFILSYNQGGSTSLSLYLEMLAVSCRVQAFHLPVGGTNDRAGKVANIVDKQ